MPRLLSTRGCIPCRARRKKCPEERPICKTCSRLSLRCAYRDTAPNQLYTNRSIVLGVFRLSSPTIQVQHFPTTNLRTARDEYVFANLSLLFGPNFLDTYSCAPSVNKDLMQIALSAEHVRDCVVACFEAFTSTQGETGESSLPQAWNIASKSLRRFLPNTDWDETLFFTLPVAVGFLAVIEFIGPGFTGNLSLHFEAGVTMVSLFQQNPECNWSRMPKDMTILMLETLLAQSTLVLFIAHRERLRTIWKRADVTETLKRLTQGRLDQSPGLAGQYEIFEVVFEVMMLHRSPTPNDISLARLDVLETQLHRIKSTVGPTIHKGQEAAITKYAWLIKTFELFCIALLIGINALRPPSATRDTCITEAVRTGLETLFEIEAVPVNNHSVIWAAHALACAITAPVDMRKIRRKFRHDTTLFQGAPLYRFTKLLNRLDQIHETPVSSAERDLRLYPDDDELPRGLLLFRQSGGVLAQEF